MPVNLPSDQPSREPHILAHPRRLILGLYCRNSGPGVAEGRDRLLREAVEVFELNLEWGAERRRANDAVEAAVALLARLQLLDDVLRSGGQEAAGLHGIFDRWRSAPRRAPVSRWPVLPVLSGRDQALATPSITNARRSRGIRCARDYTAIMAMACCRCRELGRLRRLG
jgi:hypothetical protein